MMPRRLPSPVRRAAATLALVALSGCATLDVSRDRPAIEALLAARGAGNLGWQQNGDAASGAAVDELLAKPMTVDSAVRVAMLKSPQLLEVYGQLGLARADVLEAIQVANPRIAISSLALAGGPGSQLTTGLAVPLIDLLTLPSRSRLARVDYERARYEVAAAILGVSLDVESAWYRHVAAQQVAAMRKAVADALRTSADLAQRFYDAGNITLLQLNREKAAASQAGIEATRAAVAARLARLDLNTLIGLSGPATDWAGETVLSLPLATEDDPVALQRLANDNSLELLAARKGASVAAGAAAFTRRFRLLGATSIGYEREREVDGAVIRGPTLDLELPIFNQGGARVARAEARVQLARARLARIELAAANSVALSSERVRVLAQVVGDYRTALVPERETVAAQSQLEQNFALIGQFEVLQARAQQYEAYQGLIEAVRDYWLARTDLVRLIGSRLPSDTEARQTLPSAEQYLTPPPPPAMDHSGHGGMAMASPKPSLPAPGSAAVPGPHAGHGVAVTPPAPAMDHSMHGGHDAMPMPPPAASQQHKTPTPVPAPATHHHPGTGQ